MKKFIIYFFSFAVIIIISISIYYKFNKNLIVDYIKFKAPKSLYVLVKFINNKDINIKRNLNDYNIKFLPETQFIDLDFKKIKLNFERQETGYYAGLKGKHFSFYLDANEKYLFVADSNMNLYYSKITDVIKEKNNFKNIKSSGIIKNAFSRDIKISKNDIYISLTYKNSNKCYFYKIFKAKIINLPDLNFNEIFSSKQCNPSSYTGGRIEILNDNKQKKLLLTTYNADKDHLAQEDNSIFGKILLIDENNGEYEVFSKGHRNSIGLLFDDENNVILNTENGPRGGDEINLILRDKNYGWNVSSYGDNYKKKNLDIDTPDLKFDHEKLGFQEPIFSFVSSIGISQIIKIDDNFSNYWNNNFLIGSLNSKHLYRVKFDKSFNKILYKEKIFIGERIRDLIYLSKEKTIILAMEETGSIGIIQKK